MHTMLAYVYSGFKKKTTYVQLNIKYVQYEAMINFTKSL